MKFTDDWQADAQRRDFTMNALYCDEREKSLTLQMDTVIL